MKFYLSKYLYFCFCIRAYLSYLFVFKKDKKTDRKHVYKLRLFYFKNLNKIIHTLDNENVKNLRLTQFRRRKAIFLKNEDVFVKVTYNIDSTENEYLMAKKACDKNDFNFSKMYNYIGNDGFEYIVQENIKGYNLREFFRFKNASVETQLSILNQLKEIINVLAALKIVHRDMWSKNFVFDKKENRLCLIDFEIATYNDSNSRNFNVVHIATDKTALSDLLKKHFSDSSDEVVKLKSEIMLLIKEHIENSKILSKIA